MKLIFAIIVVILTSLHALVAHADASFWGGVEYLHWEENTSPTVTEKGPIAAFGFNWTQDKPAGWLFAYQGKLYAGSVDYEGALLFSPNTPVNGTTQYTGMQHEGQLRYRRSTGDYSIDRYVGLGLNTWDRELSSTQSETYVVLYASLGLEFDRPKSSGLTGGVGMRYAFYIDENAHFDDLGYDNNPHLKPKGQVSATAHIGYRFHDNLELTGYFESIRFNDSDTVSVNLNGTLSDQFYQPGSTYNIFGIRLAYRFGLH